MCSAGQREMKRGGRSEPLAGSHAGGKRDGGRDQKAGKGNGRQFSSSGNEQLSRPRETLEDQRINQTEERISAAERGILRFDRRLRSCFRVCRAHRSKNRE